MNLALHHIRRSARANLDTNRIACDRVLLPVASSSGTYDDTSAVTLSTDCVAIHRECLDLAVALDAVAHVVRDSIGSEHTVSAWSNKDTAATARYAIAVRVNVSGCADFDASERMIPHAIAFQASTCALAHQDADASPAILEAIFAQEDVSALIAHLDGGRPCAFD